MRFIGLFFLFVGCGSAGGGSGDAGQQAPKTETSTDTEAVAATDTHRPSAEGRHSMLVDSFLVQPGCDERSEGWLIYLLTEAKFQVCASSVWSDINITGSNGKDGENGKDGVDGKDGAPASLTTWVDPITQNEWLIGGIVGPSASSVCGAYPSKWRTPSTAQVTDAATHGLRAAATALGLTSAAYDCAFGAPSNGDPLIFGTNCASRASYAVYCIRAAAP